MTAPAQRVPPFPFLVGCGRSGTTLLRAMCDSHPDLTVPPESHFVVPLAGSAGHPFNPAVFLDQLYAQERFRLWELDRAEVEAAFRRSPPTGYAGAVRAVFGAWAATQGKIRYADKTPGYVLHIPMLARLFPESVFVHLVRDGRDVACSFLELGWADTVEVAALHWRLRVLRGRHAGLALPSHRYHELRYEDLVADPEGSLRRLCDVMSVPFSAHMLAHERHAAEVVRTTSHPDYHRHLGEPTTGGLRDWRRELDPDQVMRFELLAGDLLREFDYETADRRAPLNIRLSVQARQARWQLHRIVQRIRRHNS